MRMLAFDPGYGRLGFAVIEADGGVVRQVITYGVITTPKESPSAERLHEIVRDVQLLMQTHAPQTVVLEELFFAKNVTTALKVAEVRGLLLYLAQTINANIIEIKPVQVKMALTGYGKADKRQMQEMVKVVYGLQDIPRPDDAADALAIAWAALQKC